MFNDARVFEEQGMLNTVIHGDCLDVLKGMPDGLVDMVLCDPPYGTLACEWDSLLDLDALWVQLLRVAKQKAAFVFTAQQPFATDLIVSQRKNFRYEVVWEKPRPIGFVHANKRPLRAHENVLIFYRELPTYNPRMIKGKLSKRVNKPDRYSGYRTGGVKADVHESDERFPRSVIEFGNHNADLEHPTQKPVALFEYLIRTYTNPGDTVLDPTAGSGTTGVACKKSGRHFILIEREEAYVKIAQRRISEVPDSLFD